MKGRDSLQKGISSLVCCIEVVNGMCQITRLYNGVNAIQVVRSSEGSRLYISCNRLENIFKQAQNKSTNF